MQDRVILDMETDSPTIRWNAQNILGYDKKRIKAFGVAFKPCEVGADSQKGIEDSKSMQLNHPGYGIETAQLLDIIKGMI